VTPFLLKALILPLSAGAIISLWISAYAYEPWSGLLVNLAAGFVVTVMTVLYVDVVLHRHHVAQWKSVKERVCLRVERLANVSITSVRISLRVGTEVLDRDYSVANNTSTRRALMTEVAEDVLTNEMRNIRNLDAKGWSLLANNLQGASENADRILATFGPHLERELTEGILALQDAIGAALASYSTFPDIFGVAPDKLPKRMDGSSSIPTQNTLYAGMEVDLKQLLAVAAGLLRTLERGRPGLGMLHT
jgi:hypothetical protein